MSRFVWYEKSIVSALSSKMMYFIMSWPNWYENSKVGALSCKCFILSQAGLFSVRNQ